jgi:hypothetical protein
MKNFSKSIFSISGIALIACLFFFGCVGRRNMRYPGPSLMPNTERNMKVAAFWISLLPDPDKVILDSQGIEKFNKAIKNELKLLNDIENYPSVISSAKFKGEITKTLKRFKRRKFYTKSNEKIDKKIIKDIEENISLKNIQENINISFGLVSRYAHQRLLPTKDELFSKKEDFDFDVLQNNSLDVGTPVAILHKSADSQWIYVEGPSSSGWTEIENIALSNREQIKQYINGQPFAVISKTKASIFLKSSLTEYYDYVRMGTRLPIGKKTSIKAVPIIIPFRNEDGKVVFGEGYLKENEMNEGYFPYTPRNIIQQSFEMLDMPYGWGGMNGEQDCSGFIQQVFMTVGIYMPKNSLEQSWVGKLLEKFNKKTSNAEKIEFLDKKAVSGATILYLSGHVMLFLGVIDNNPYVIHGIYGYHEKGSSPERVRVINRVVVSDLSLGEGSKKGSLLKRLSVVRLLAE